MGFREVINVFESVVIVKSSFICLKTINSYSTLHFHMAYNTSSRPEAWDNIHHIKPKKQRSLWRKITGVFGCKKIERLEVEDPTKTPTRYSKLGPSSNSSFSPSPLLLHPSLRSPIKRRYG
ncbi:hypothetical protein QVD17_32222 [Tagetes erecta]|uniref:Uncharacterized protein n=1 Tax=Tagetes erecta TaxID=13708 RepID=A0AAD8NPY1_TARER|nr:hypothetical protein QVD17_32222 [Tagetes erecta]